MGSLGDFLLAAVLIVSLAVHLVCVNVAAVGPLACIGLQWRARKVADACARATGKWLAHLCCAMLLAGMLLGFIQVLFIYLSGREAFFSALGRVPASRLYWGAAELLFYFACMVPYAIAWDRLSSRRFFHPLLALLAATNLIYHFPPLFVVISQLAGEPHGDVVLDNAEFRRVMFSNAVLAQVAHHLLAAVAVVGVVVAWRAARSSDPESPEQTPAGRLTRRAAWWALGASVLQIPSGVWFLFNLPPAGRQSIMSGSSLASAFFIAALVGALMLMHKLAAVAMGETDRRTVKQSLWLLLLVITLMSAVLYLVKA